MDTNDLIEERVRVTERVTQLEGELNSSRERLAALDKVLSGLRELGLLDQPPPSVKAPEPEVAAAPAASEDGTPDLVQFALDALKHKTVTTRIQSTTLVAQLVNSVGHPMNRDEVIDRFEQTHGFPDSWRNPRNNLGNALARAHENGDIDRFGDMFAPKGYFERIQERGGRG
jgi:hypothetical protein